MDPVIVVDLDHATRQVTAASGLLPSVVVGVSRAADPSSLAVAGVDLAITDRVDARRPWVSRSDLDEAIAAITSRVEANPIAAATLVQVLRAGEGQPVVTGLMLESTAYSTLQGGPEFEAWCKTSRPAPRGNDGDEQPVLIERDERVLRITLNRPGVHNAYNALMRDALVDALSIAAADESVEQVELYGAGPSFCSGGDLSEFGTLSDPASAHLIRTLRSPAHLLSQMSARVTAHLHGACIGSGIELPAFAASVHADPDTTIRLPELSMGLIPGAGGTVSVARRIGRRRTAWLVLSGEAIDARTAADWGLADAVQSL